MYVCVCNALTEEQVRHAAQGGSGRARDVFARMGCEPKCGACVPLARRIAGEVKMANSRLTLVPAE